MIQDYSSACILWFSSDLLHEFKFGCDVIVGGDDYVANIQTLSRDMIKLQLTQRFRCATPVPCRVGVTLCCDFYALRRFNTCIFTLTTCAVLTTFDNFFAGVVSYIIGHLLYETV